MDDKIVKFIEVYAPYYGCSLKCSYCYVTQHPVPNRKIEYKYTAEEFEKAITKKRMGGTCIFNLCSNGETLAPRINRDYCKAILKEGHFISIVSNMIHDEGLEDILSLSNDDMSRTFFKCSLHYKELKKNNLLEKFATNVNRAYNSGASITVEIVPTDDLEPFINEIKEYSLNNFGALPHVTIGRNENVPGFVRLTSHTKDEYNAIWSTFDSELFRFKNAIWGNKIDRLCPAGSWMYCFNLEEGKYYPCNCGKCLGDFMEGDSLKDIPTLECSLDHCYNGHSWLALSGYPINETTYAKERDRVRKDGTHWLHPRVLNAFSQHLCDNNRKIIQTIKNVKYCTGCYCCVSVCPKKAIAMNKDEDGFLKPEIDTTKCIKCGICYDRCPTITPVKRNLQKPTCTAVIAKDPIRNISTSGGLFTILANYTFERNGIVYGAVWDKNNEVYIKRITNPKQLNEVRHSKYVQSQTRNSFNEVLTDLKNGLLVLYSALPCQIAGLHSFLGKEYQNLITVEVLCGQAPSSKAFLSYINEKNNEKHKVCGAIFRNDREWNPHNILLKYDDGKVERCTTWTNDPYLNAYMQTVMASDTCKYCKYSHIPRQSDITIGDFWGIKKIDGKLDDGYGTSLMLKNNNRYDDILKYILFNTKKCRKIELSDVLTTPNRINSKEATFYAPVEKRKSFYEMLKHHSFTKTVNAVAHSKFDVGIVTIFSHNIGGCLTYYALYKYLEQIGLTAVMIERRMDSPSKPHKNPFAMYNVVPYPPTSIPLPVKNFEEMTKYNDKCEKFILGSDQLLNPNFIRRFDFHTCMGWVKPSKVKIGLAVSIGRNEFEGDEYFKNSVKEHLQRFDKISVRENSAIKILKNNFDIETDRVLDPVFICGLSPYDELIKNKTIDDITGPFIGCYILDPSESRRKMIESVENKYNLKSYILGDPYISKSKYEQCGIKLINDAKIEDWLYIVKKCSYFITDSFHGACFAMMYNKPFVLIVNRFRGTTRIETLKSIFNIESRIVDDSETKIDNIFEEEIDYNEINNTMSLEIEKTKTWINNALSCNPKYNDDGNWENEKKKFQNPIVSCYNPIIDKIRRQYKQIIIINIANKLGIIQALTLIDKYYKECYIVLLASGLDKKTVDILENSGYFSEIYRYTAAGIVKLKSNIAAEINNYFESHFPAINYISKNADEIFVWCDQINLYGLYLISNRINSIYVESSKNQLSKKWRSKAKYDHGDISREYHLLQINSGSMSGINEYVEIIKHPDTDMVDDKLRINNEYKDEKIIEDIKTIDSKTKMLIEEIFESDIDGLITTYFSEKSG